MVESLVKTRDNIYVDSSIYCCNCGKEKDSLVNSLCVECGIKHDKAMGIHPRKYTIFGKTVIIEDGNLVEVTD